FVRVGGHYVTMAGVNSELLKVAFSDPDRDYAENGFPGRVRPPHPPHPADPLLHNDPSFVSQDIYTSTETSPSPGNPHWGLTDYLTVRGLSPNFEGKNFHPSQLKYYSPSREGKGPQFIEVEYALMICPKPSAVENEEIPNVPHDFELYQNYPNPFNPTTTIHFTVHRPSSAVSSPFPTTLKIYNILGQLVKTLVNEPKSTGEYQVVWAGKDERGNNLASGIYFYRLQIGEQTQTKRMLLLK
ncbi:MAG TPA: T9SS type A sorting domain-containing protein, partial [candidate division Zixibacteria bacterium]